MEDCTFCKIINRELPAHILSEDDHTIVFMSLQNHPLVIPKKHIKDIYSLDPDTGAKVIKEVVTIANATKKGLASEGIYVTQANEKAGGQHVFHIHFHVYPRWEGVAMNQYDVISEEEREATFKKIKAAL